MNNRDTRKKTLRLDTPVDSGCSIWVYAKIAASDDLGVTEYYKRMDAENILSD